jgi:fucose 4-O-acetylase-like acetyltransferase
LIRLATPLPVQARVRDPFFDNAKFLAIVLVVIGHALEPVRDTHLAVSSYVFIYSFHMPLFIMITGYFSRGFTEANDRTRKLVVSLLAPYVIFQFAYIAFERLYGHDLRIQIFDPYGLLWFIVAVLVWRLSTPFWQRVRWPLTIAVVISLWSYVYPLPGELDIQNTVGMVPFYVAGLLLKPAHFELLKQRAVRAAAVVVLLGTAAWAWLYGRQLNLAWLYWGTSIGSKDVSVPTGLVIQLGMLAGGAVLAFAFLAVVPRRQRWFSRLGANTLYVYLLHGFFVLGCRYQGWYEPAWLHTVVGTALVVALSVAVATVLSTPQVKRVFSPVLEPKLHWVFRAGKSNDHAQDSLSPERFSAVSDDRVSSRGGGEAGEASESVGLQR